MVSAPLFGYMYKATIETFPGAFLLFSSVGYESLGVCVRVSESDFLLCECRYAVCAVLFVVIFFGLRKVQRREDEVAAESDKEEKAEQRLMALDSKR